jgi:hypothetical protein
MNRMKQTFLALGALGAVCLGGVVSATAMTPQHAPRTTLHITLQQQAFSGVTGSATLVYDPATKMTTVTVSAHHLEPGSLHPSHIHAGTCRTNGPVLEGLNSIKADAHGNGVATTTFKGSVLNKAAHVNIHMGPGLALTQYTVIACGELGKSM